MELPNPNWAINSCSVCVLSFGFKRALYFSVVSGDAMGNNVISIFMLVRFRCNILILIAFVCGMKLRDTDSLL